MATSGADASGARGSMLTPYRLTSPHMRSIDATACDVDVICRQRCENLPTFKRLSCARMARMSSTNLCVMHTPGTHRRTVSTSQYGVISVDDVTSAGCNANSHHTVAVGGSAMLEGFADQPALLSARRAGARAGSGVTQHAPGSWRGRWRRS
jgi:hypothetical protein